MNVAGGIGRPVMQDEYRRVLAGLEDTAVDILAVPFGKLLGFAFVGKSVRGRLSVLLKSRCLPLLAERFFGVAAGT